MAEGNYPRDWVKRLSSEAKRWVRDGLITEEQRSSIIGLYPAETASGRDRTVLIISILGSLLVGAGVILFFAANWARIPATVKVAAIMLATVGTYGAGYYLQYVKGDYPRLGHSLIFLGSLFYGAAIWLIAQIFHLESKYPNGFFVWGLGALPIAWAAASRPVLYLSAAVLGIWTIMEQTDFMGYNPLFPVLALLAVLPLARRMKDLLAEAAVLVGLFIWFGLNVGRMDLESAQTHEAVIFARTMLLYGTAVLSLGLSGIGDMRPYLSVGSVAALGGLYVLTFSSGNPAVAAPGPLAGSPFLLGGMALFLAVTIGGAYLYYKRAEAGRTPLLSAIGLILLAAATAHLMPQVSRMVAANLLLFAGTISLVVLGIQRRSELLINLGLLAFLIHIITRYFDLFFDALDKSLFFVLGGILLLGGGWLIERNRRRWIGELGGDAR